MEWMDAWMKGGSGNREAREPKVGKDEIEEE